MAQPTMFDARSKIGAGGFVFGIAFGAMLTRDIHYQSLMSRRRNCGIVLSMVKECKYCFFKP